MTKILVIEDEEIVLDNILELLILENFDAIGAKNGYVGVQLAQEQLPDLIICDIMMPGLDGYNVLHALRENPNTSTISFIFLTAKAAKDDWRQGMIRGAEDYITKPFKNSELLSAISTQLRKNAEIKQQSEEKLNQLRRNITWSLPHELRTPLNAILGLAEILKEEYNSMEQAEVLETANEIYDSAKRLYRLISNFELYAQLEIIASDPEKLNLLRNDSTKSTLITITKIANKQSQKLGRSSDLILELTDASIKISETGFIKIVEELIDNAFKYSPSETPIRLISKCNNSKFVFQVINVGRGMTLEHINNIGAYMQFDRKRYEQQGSGLGLTIVKRLAELYGGELTIESVPNEQTIVSVILPQKI